MKRALNNEEKWKDSTLIESIKAYETINIVKNIQFDSTLTRGYYYIEAKMHDPINDWIGYTVSENIKYGNAYLNILLKCPDFWKDTNIINFDILNIGEVLCKGGKIELSLENQNTGESILTDELNFGSIEAGNRITIEKELNVNWNDVKSGEYRLYYTLIYNNQKYAYYKNINATNNYAIKNEFSKAFYGQNELLNGKIEIYYGADVERETEINLSIPYLGWDSSWTDTYNPLNKEYSYQYTVLLPNDIGEGYYDVKIEVSKKNGEILNSHISRFNIPGFKIKAEGRRMKAEGETYYSGEEVEIEIENIGGVRGTGEYSVELRDNTNYPLISYKKQITLNAGEKYDTGLLLEEQLKTGKYYIKLTAISSQESASFDTTGLINQATTVETQNFASVQEETTWYEIQVEGIQAELQVVAASPEIDSTDIAKVKIDIENTGTKKIENGKFNVKLASPYLGISAPKEIEKLFYIENNPENARLYSLSNGELIFIWEDGGNIKYRRQKSEDRSKNSIWGEEEIIVSGGNNHNPVLLESGINSSTQQPINSSTQLWLVYEKQNSIWIKESQSVRESESQSIISEIIWGDEKKIAVGSKPKIIEIASAAPGNDTTSVVPRNDSEIIIFYLRQDREIAYRTNSDNFAREEVVPLPYGYKESFDVLITPSPQSSPTRGEEGKKIWLSYVGEDRNIYYAVGNIQTLTTDTDTALITWQTNFSSTTKYTRDLWQADIEAEDLLVSGKSKGVSSFQSSVTGEKGIKLAPGYEVGWMESGEINLPGMAQILEIKAEGSEKSSTQQPTNSSTHQLNFWFSVGEKVYDSTISKPEYRVREGWPKILNDAKWAWRTNPEAGDIDGDGKLEILLNTPNRLYAWKPDGTIIENFPVGFASGDEGGFVVLEDFNSDGKEEMMVNKSSGLYMFDNHGKVNGPGADYYYYNYFEEPSLHTGDFDGDGLPDIGTSDYIFINAWDIDKPDSPFKLKLSNYPVTQIYTPSTNIGLLDIDKDKKEEIMVNSDFWIGAINVPDKWRDLTWDEREQQMSTSGWPHLYTRINLQDEFIKYLSLAIGNMDDDPEKESVVYHEPYVLIYDNDGSIMKSIKIAGLDERPGVCISLGDIDGDNKLEICLWNSNKNQFKVINSEGKEYNLPYFNGWGQNNFTTPIIGDIDGDGEPEVIIVGDNRIYAYHNTGEKVAGFPINLGDINFNNYDNSPILTDLEGDGKLEIVLAGRNNSGKPVIYVIDTKAWYDPENIEWAQYGANSKHNFRQGEHKGKYWYGLPYARWANFEGSSEGRIKLKTEFYRDGNSDSSLMVLDKFNIAYTTGKKGENPKLIQLPDGQVVIAYEEKENGASTQKYIVPGTAQPPTSIALNGNINMSGANFVWIGDKLYEIWKEPDRNGYSFYWGEAGGAISGNTLYSYETTLSLFPGDKISWIQDLGKIESSGNYLIEGKLFSSIGQKLKSAQTEIRVLSASGISLEVKTDKDVYSIGDIVNIQAMLTNKGGNFFSGQLKIFSGEDEIYTESIQLEAGASYLCQTNTVANENFQLRASINPVIIKNIEVVKPEIQMYLDAPSIAGVKSFPITLRLYNPTKLEMNIQVKDVNGLMSGWIDGNIQVILKPQEWTVIKQEMNISQNTIFAIKITGDVDKTIQKEIKFGEKLDIDITPESKYAEGKINIPYIVKNIEEMGVDGELKIEVETQNFASVQKIEKIYIEKNQSKDMQFVTDLSAGAYKLKIKYFMDSTETEFNVIPKEQVKIEEINIGRSVDGLIPVNFAVNNIGFNAIGGQVEINTGFYQDRKEADIESGDSKNYVFQINPAAISGGSYPLKISVESGTGIINTFDTSFIVSECKFIIEPVTQVREYIAGQAGKIIFKIKNIGDRTGRASITIDMASFYQDKKEIWLASGEEREQEINFKVPEDMIKGEYKAEIHIEGEKIPASIPFTVKGIELKVDAQFNQEGYKQGDMLKLTLNISNAANSNSLATELFCRVKYDTTELEQNFTITDRISLEYNMQLAQITGEKLFVGIYQAVTHRSVYLNELYVRKQEDVINVSVDKQVYNPGENVSVNIQNSISGSLKLNGPGGWEWSGEIENGQTRQILSLPLKLISGPYFISYNFKSKNSEEEFSGSIPFDIAGIDLKIPYITLDKNSYIPGDTIKGKMLIKSDVGVDIQIETWLLKPDGYNGLLTTGDYKLLPGENFIEFSGELKTDQSGLHQLFYIVNESVAKQYLMTTRQLLEVGVMNISGIKLNAVEYPYGTEEVLLSSYIYSGGNDEQGEVTIKIDTTSVQQKSIQGKGLIVDTTSFTSEQIQPGQHILTMNLQSGGLKSKAEKYFDYGTKLPDLIIKNVEFGSTEIDQYGKGYKLVKVEVVKNREMPAKNIIIKVETQNFASLQEKRSIGEMIIPELIENGAIGKVEFRLDLDVIASLINQATINYLQIQISVDPDNTIREYNENNNIYTKNIYLPKAPEIDYIAEATNSKYIIIHGTAEANSRIKIYQNNQLIGTVYTDNNGNFEYRLELVEGENNITAVSYTNEGGSSWTGNIQKIERDTIPPPAITGLTGEGKNKACELYWASSNAEDAAGYKVYRRKADEAEPYNPITGIINSTYYYDSSVEVNIKYSYVATVLDRAGNESSFSNQVTLSSNPGVKLFINKYVKKDQRRILVYADENFDSTIPEILNQSGAIFYITNCKKEFYEKLNTREYNMYIIDESENFEKDKKTDNKNNKDCSSVNWDLAIKELCEAIYSGDGFIWIKAKEGNRYPEIFDNVLGIKQKGYSGEKENWDFKITDSTWIKENVYGQGKAVLFTFNPKSINSTQENIEKKKKLLNIALEYIQPKNVVFEPYNNIPIEITVKADQECDLIIRENYAGLKAKKSNGQINEAQEEVQWNLRIADSTDMKTLFVNLQMADRGGTYILKTFSQYLAGSKWETNEYTPELKIEIKESIKEKIAGIITEINNLRIKSGRDKELLDKLNKIQKSSLDTSKNIEESINRLLECAKILEWLIVKEPAFSYQIKSIHIELSYILLGYEVIWSEKSYNGGIDIISPQVVLTNPINGATRVNANIVVSATFSEEIDKASINGNTFQVEQAEGLRLKVEGEVTYNNLIAAFTPMSPLEPNDIYTATITTGVRDLAGNILAQNYSWSFTTLDTISPQVIAISPQDKEINISTSMAISVKFSEDIDAGSINETSFQVEQAEGLRLKVEGEVTYNNRVATFIPANILEPNTIYTVTITNGIKDIAGNALVENYVWNFTTIDTIPPEIVTINPIDKANGVPIDTVVAIKFSEEMDGASVNGNTFQVEQAEGLRLKVEGEVTYNNRIATFTPTSPLESNAIYAAAITTGVKDLAGNTLPQEYTWSFGTLDMIPPQVVSVNPADGAKRENVNAVLTVSFSENIDETSVNGNTFQVEKAEGLRLKVEGKVTYNNRVATFIPMSSLEPNAIYTVTIAKNVKDLAGNEMLQDYIWSFSTPDTIPPRVVSVNPVNGAIWVNVNTGIAVTFSEDMDGANISETTFQVEQAEGLRLTDWVKSIYINY
ncbi:Ig-like domain-containing protein [Candidatus Desantisbacteria bacterium]|nr:Ig-like domain-containing protein [Candidatus Desantisbacteria bacterium]